MKIDLSQSTRFWSLIILIDDIKLFPEGSQTHVGEKAVNLSGGQRHRISLARAVYSDSDMLVYFHV